MSTLLKAKKPIREAAVQLSDDESFIVRGLNPNQVQGLYYRHAGELSVLFDRVMAGFKETGTAAMVDMQSIVLGLMGDAPVILAELIVLASGGDPLNTDTVNVGTDDEPEWVSAWDAALRIAHDLPFPVQAATLEAIGDLTFTSDMPPGKFVALVVKTAKRAAGAIQNQKSQTV